MSARFYVADVEFAEAVVILDPLPPGHHHVHVTEDGTVTAVPMVRAYSTLLRERPPRELVSWVDAP